MKKINLNYGWFFKERFKESDLKIKVYQGLPKGPKMEMILQKLTEVLIF